MIPRSRVHKAIWVLRAFDPGELQAYTAVEVPRKIGRKRESPIVKRDIFVSGCGIPASTISRFQSGEFTLRERSIRKLSAFYDRYMKVRLKASGANERDARRFSRYEPEKLKPILYDYSRWARKIRANYLTTTIRKYRKDIPLIALQYTMSKSRHRYSDWEYITSISGLVRKRMPKVRKGYGYHRGG